ncbi:MAG: HAD family hydrolase [Candidatus Competibacteraceae bacterium]
MKKALFLDRDGVINVEKDYVYRIEDFEFLDGIFELIRAAQQADYLPIVITNQSGIARGYYTEKAFQELTRWMIDEFLSRGITIAKVYHCPFHPEAKLEIYKVDAWDRKPNPGMLLHAKSEFGLDLNRSILVGDKESDMEAGRRAGVGRLVMLSEYSSLSSGNDIVSFETLKDITEFLFGHTVKPC